MKRFVLNAILLSGFLSANAQTAGSGVTDIDGNVYTSVIINSKEWTVENLKTTKYSNGNPISNITDNALWQSASSGAWAYYDNDVANNAVYGKLYNGYAVKDSRGLCPTGWHVPTVAEFNDMLESIGGEYEAGSKLKATGNTYWSSDNTDATNSTGFTGLPGGERNHDGSFLFKNQYGFWRLAEDERFYLAYNSGATNVAVLFGIAESYGESVRCMKNYSTTGLNNNAGQGILALFPNPVYSDLTVVIADSRIGASYEVKDMMGKVVLSGVLENERNQILLDEMQTGIYYLQIGTSGKSYKIIKK